MAISGFFWALEKNLNTNKKINEKISLKGGNNGKDNIPDQFKSVQRPGILARTLAFYIAGGAGCGLDALSLVFFQRQIHHKQIKKKASFLQARYPGKSGPKKSLGSKRYVAFLIKTAFINKQLKDDF